MDHQKIQISWDDLHSTDVDAKLLQQAAVARAQTHYEQFPPIPAQADSGRLWYHPVCYMAWFGFLGGLLAWGTGEVGQLLAPNEFAEFSMVARLYSQIDDLRRRGEWSSQEAEEASERLLSRYADNPYLQIINDDLLSPRERTRQLEALKASDRKKLLVSETVFFGVIGLALSLALAIADSVVSRNWRGVLTNSSLGMLLGLGGGVAVGLFINRFYNWLGGGVDTSDLTKQVIARSIGWAVLGLFLAIAPGILLRSWKRLGIGLAGGFLGGLVGGLLFDAIAQVTSSVVLSRFVAIVSIGLVTGAATGLLESVAKTGWLRIVAGLIAGKQFILYRNPTIIGSSPQCEIYLFKDPQISPRHAALHIVRGGFELEDLQSATGTFVNDRLVSRCRLHAGDRIRIGQTTCQFEQKTGGAPG